MEISATTRKIDIAPVARHYMEDLKLFEIFQKYLPKKSNESIAPAQVVCMLVLNIICARHPLYAIREWMADYTDGPGEAVIEAAPYDDNRFARKLDDLFEVDRHTLLTEITSEAIRVHNLDTDTIHNDSTSVSLEGAYENYEMGTVNITPGYNKDHRRDCKQIVFNLNMTADGNVPISYQLYDGNAADGPTHMPNWDELRQLLAKEEFLYIADCKLCDEGNLLHIHFNGGKFITLMPANRKEVKAFREFIKDNDVEWTESILIENSRKSGEYTTYKIFEDSITTDPGFRVIHLHSDQKEAADQHQREKKVQKILNDLDDISRRLNQRRLKRKEQIESAVKKACKGSEHLFAIDLIEEKEIVRKQVGAGKPGPNTVYKEEEQTSFRLDYGVDEMAVQREHRADGLFSLITNDAMSGGDVLKNYKNQAYLEKRIYTAKSVLNVAPIFLQKPKRIEAMLFLYFVALMIVGLIERRIRNNMREEGVESLPILPNKMKTQTPTKRNIEYFFRNVRMVIIKDGEGIISKIVTGLTDIHQRLLSLLGVPIAVYQKITDQRWWLFGCT